MPRRRGGKDILNRKNRHFLRTWPNRLSGQTPHLVVERAEASTICCGDKKNFGTRQIIQIPSILTPGLATFPNRGGAWTGGSAHRIAEAGADKPGRPDPRMIGRYEILFADHIRQ